MTRAVLGLLLVLLACSSGTGGSSGPDPDASSSAAWGGTYDATITATVTNTAGQSQTGSGVEALQVSADGATWTRPGGCVLVWRVDGSSAVASAGQECQTTAGGNRLRLRLTNGSATLAGRTINGTLRWDVSSEQGVAAGTMTETLAAVRR